MKKIISLLLIMAMCFATCFCIVACSPEEKEVVSPPEEIDPLQAVREAHIESTKYTYGKAMKAVTARFEVFTDSSLYSKEAKMRCCVDYMERVRDEAIEKIKQQSDVESIEKISKSAYNNLHGASYGYAMHSTYFSGGKYDKFIWQSDEFDFSIDSDCVSPLSTMDGGFILTASDQTVRFIGLAEQGDKHWRNQTKRQEVESSENGAWEYTLYCCNVYDTIGSWRFIIQKDGEIAGYAVFDVESPFAKAVVFDKADRANLTEEKVIEYMDLALEGKEGEFADNIKVSCCVLGSMVNDNFYLRPWKKDDSGKLYNEIEIDCIYDYTKGIEWEIWSDDVTLIHDGEQGKKITVSERGDTVRWDASNSGGWIFLKYKVAGENTAIGCIKMENLEGVYKNSEYTMPKAVAFWKITMKDYGTPWDADVIISDEAFDSYIDTMRTLVESAVI